MSVQIREIFIGGKPIGQPRHRTTSNGRLYLPDKHPVHGWKARIIAGCREKWPHITTIEGPIHLHLTFTMPRPNKHLLSGKKGNPVREGAPKWHTSKPDVDNLAKAVLDAITYARVWNDDDQVCFKIASKRYGTPAGVHIRIEEFG